MIRLLKISLFFFVLFAFSFSACKSSGDDDPSDPKPPTAPKTDLLIGADLSKYFEIYNNVGALYYRENGEQIEPYMYLNYKGFNLARYRLWHTPVSSYDNFENVWRQCGYAQHKGFEVLLDIHYSDTWADPGHQSLPKAWEGLSYEILKDSVYQYTRRILSFMYIEIDMPLIVQIGNETNSGFLWPHGKIVDDSPESWEKYTGLIEAASKAVRDVGGKEIEIMLHFAGIEGADWYFNRLQDYNVDYDWIGLSWYPMWHTHDLDWMENQLKQLKSKTGKHIMIVETAYPFTLDWNDEVNNLCGLQEQLVDGYPATSQGQVEMMNRLLDMLDGLRDEDTKSGLCYWAPEWVSLTHVGSPWENMCLFDFDHRALPVINEFDRNKTKDAQK